MRTISSDLSHRLAAAFQVGEPQDKAAIGTWLSESSEGVDEDYSTLEDLPDWIQDLIHLWEDAQSGVRVRGADPDEDESGPAVLVTLNGYADPRAALSVVFDGDNVDVRFADGSTETLVAASGTIEKSRTGIVRFSDSESGADYIVRPIEESDGYWLSKYQTALPDQALSGLVSQTSEEGPIVAETIEDGESMIAYQERGETDIIGVAYYNEIGKWVRIGGDWIQAAHDDDQFNDTVAYEVLPETVDDFLQVFDTGPLSSGDVKKYLSPLKG
jgi:hypothetical protein